MNWCPQRKKKKKKRERSTWISLWIYTWNLCSIQCLESLFFFFFFADWAMHRGLFEIDLDAQENGRGWITERDSLCCSGNRHHYKLSSHVGQFCSQSFSNESLFTRLWVRRHFGFLLVQNSMHTNDLGDCWNLLVFFFQVIWWCFWTMIRSLGHQWMQQMRCLSSQRSPTWLRCLAAGLRMPFWGNSPP